MGRPVNPLVFELEPLANVSVGRLPTDKSVTSPESLPNEVVGPLHLPFYPGGIRRGDTRLESIMQCKSRKCVVELVFAG